MAYLVFSFERDDSDKEKTWDIVHEVRHIAVPIQLTELFDNQGMRIDFSLRRGHRYSELGWEVYKILANNPPIRGLLSVAFFEEDGTTTTLYPSRPVGVS